MAGTKDADPALPGSRVVGTTTNCEIVLYSHGFYARCTRCPWVSETEHAKFRARMAAQEHDADAQI